MTLRVAALRDLGQGRPVASRAPATVLPWLNQRSVFYRQSASIISLKILFEILLGLY